MSLPPYSIVVDFVSEGEVANLIKGYIEVKGKKVRFSGVAYGRFGGQNFSPQFSNQAKGSLTVLVGDFTKFEEDVQLRLVRGDFDSRPPKGEKHHHHHLGVDNEEGRG
jgi:hypothetical protein